MKIAITGIKSLKLDRQYVKFSDLNIVTGKNSSGKTSFKTGLEILSDYFRTKNIDCIRDIFDAQLEVIGGSSESSIQFISNGKNLKYETTFGKNDIFKVLIEYRYEGEVFMPYRVKIYIHEQLLLDYKMNDRLIEPKIFISNLDYNLLYGLFQAITYKLDNPGYTSFDEFKVKFGILEDKSELVEWFYESINAQADAVELHKLLLFIKNRCNDLYGDMDFAQEIGDAPANISDLEQVLWRLNPNENASEFNADWKLADYEMTTVSNYLFCAEDEWYLEKENQQYFGVNEYVTHDSHEKISIHNFNDSAFISILFTVIKRVCDKAISHFAKINCNVQFVSLDHVKQKSIHCYDDNSSLYKECQFFESNKGKLYKKVLSDWIGKEVLIENYGNGLAYRIMINENDSAIDVAHIGMGDFIFLTLCIKIISTIGYKRTSEETRVLYISEPERFCHPDLQGKLGSLFCWISGVLRQFKIQLVVETHSEYLIRNVQLEVAKQISVSSANVNIYYFELENGSTTIRQIGLDRNGFLKNQFGSGFYDESQKLIEELYRVKEN